ncbi:MAG: hypothetical protein VYC19_09225 [Pseudomonadota bacterium]|jgi:hypothetical protein|nr:hypothetical protein [Pseudomonadota bacterium]MEC9234744.1 hypothetical protein [Pseudomonadota bacterium]
MNKLINTKALGDMFEQISSQHFGIDERLLFEMQAMALQSQLYATARTPKVNQICESLKQRNGDNTIGIFKDAAGETYVSTQTAATLGEYLINNIAGVSQQAIVNSLTTALQHAPDFSHMKANLTPVTP